MTEAKHTAGRSRYSDLDIARAIHYNERLRAAASPERDLDADADAFIAELDADAEISVIDRMIEENSRDAANAQSEASRRGFKENIERLETERDRLIDAALAKAGGAA